MNAESPASIDPRAHHAPLRIFTPRKRAVFASVKLAAVVVMFAVVWPLGLSATGDALWLAFTLLLTWRARAVQMVCLCISLVVAAGLAEAALRFVRHHRGTPLVIQRDSDRFIRNIRFEPNVDETLPHTQGDLTGMDPSIASAVVEPRRERFKTDSVGYRNDAEYHGQSVILSGDSFVVGIGTDQRDTLPVVLREEFGIDNYSIAFPNDPSHYFIRSADFAKRVQRPICILMFIFEGNDFVSPPRHLSEPGEYEKLKLRTLHGPLEGFVLPEMTFNALRRLERMASQADKLVEVFNVGTKPMAFHGNYIDAALKAKLELRPIDGDPLSVDPASVAPLIKGVFFIPTKFRVYFDHLHRDGPTLVTPAPGYITTRDYFAAWHVPVIDLTPTLKARAEELLPQGKYVYWRDDTHWNGEGIRAAAAAVAEFLKSHPCAKNETASSQSINRR